jgi:hypothetical protein
VLRYSFFCRSLSTIKISEYSTVIAVDRRFFASLRFQLFRAIIKYVWAYEDKKARVLEKGCIVAKKEAIGPIFEGNMLPQKKDPFSCPVDGQ